MDTIGFNGLLHAAMFGSITLDNGDGSGDENGWIVVVVLMVVMVVVVVLVLLDIPCNNASDNDDGTLSAFAVVVVVAIMQSIINNNVLCVCVCYHKVHLQNFTLITFTFQQKKIAWMI